MEIERIQIENEEERAVLETGLDETMLELAAVRDGQSEKSSVLQERLDAMASSHKHRMLQIFGMVTRYLFCNLVYFHICCSEQYLMGFFFFLKIQFWRLVLASLRRVFMTSSRQPRLVTRHLHQNLRSL